MRTADVQNVSNYRRYPDCRPKMGMTSLAAVENISLTRKHLIDFIYLFKKLDQPLKGLRAILTSVTHLTVIDTKEWHTRDAERPCSQQSICQELASSVSAISLAGSTPPDEQQSTTSRCEVEVAKVEENGVGAPKSETPVFTAKAKSAQLVEQRTALHRHHLPHHLHIKQHGDSNQTLSSTLNVSSLTQF